jgi:hypothetical protein
MYNRYAESARVNWTRNFAASDPTHEKQWMELITPKSIGLILRSITTDYKFVSICLIVCMGSLDVRADWTAVRHWCIMVQAEVEGLGCTTVQKTRCFPTLLIVQTEATELFHHHPSS